MAESKGPGTDVNGMDSLRASSQAQDEKDETMMNRRKRQDGGRDRQTPVLATLQEYFV